jgi:thioredoxin 1
MGSNTFEVTETNFQTEVLESPTPVLIDFWAEWCAPCKMIGPIVEELSVEYAGRLRVGKLDTDANQNILYQYGVMGIPTLILFKDGKPVERVVGFKPKERIISQLEPHLS